MGFKLFLFSQLDHYESWSAILHDGLVFSKFAHYALWPIIG